MVNKVGTFLSSDLIQKLQDPTLRAAVEVIVEGLPKVMELHEKAKAGPWEVTKGASGKVRAIHRVTRWDGFMQSEGAEANAELIVATRNLIFRASQAAQAATDKP